MKLKIAGPRTFVRVDDEQGNLVAYIVGDSPKDAKERAELFLKMPMSASQWRRLSKPQERMLKRIRKYGLMRYEAKGGEHQTLNSLIRRGLVDYNPPTQQWFVVKGQLDQFQGPEEHDYDPEERDYDPDEDRTP